MDITNVPDITTCEGMYNFLKENHDKVKEFWIRVNRSSKPESGVIGYVDAVEVALCFGWIDSTLKRIDSGKPFQRILKPAMTKSGRQTILKRIFQVRTESRIRF